MSRKTAPESRGDPLAFGTALDAACADAAEMKEGVVLSVTDGQFWFVLPDGILRDNPSSGVTVSYLRFTAEGRRANMMARMVFMRENGALVDSAGGKRMLVEFQPCVVLSRNKEGRPTAQQVDDLDGPPKDLPPPPAEAEGTAVPDIGELLAGLQETRQSLATIDELLTEPDALLDEDVEKRAALQETIAATKDRALTGLGELGEVLARGAEQPLEEWRANVSAALGATIEAVVAFEDLAEHVREGKRQQLEALRASIDSYFATIDPRTDGEACRKFSKGINQLILEERKDSLTTKKALLEKNVERAYDHIIAALQQTLGKGSSLPLIPHPALVPASGFETKIVFNMIHIAMAVLFGGLSIRLETEGHPRLYNELRGWDETNPPRVHIVDRSRYAKARRAGAGKSGLAAFE